MDCLRCAASNPDSKKYCGDCGAPLQLDSASVRDFLATGMREEIQRAIKDQLKDQKVVEVEVTEAIVTRLSNWGKALTYLVGVPLGLLVLVLSILGINKLSDLSGLVDVAKHKAELTMNSQIEDARKQVETAQKDMSSKVDQARKDVDQQVVIAREQANKLKSETDQLLAELNQYRPQLAELKDVNKRLSTVEAKLSPGISLSVVDGARRPMNGNLLVSLLDGNQKQVWRGFVKGPEIVVANLPIQDNLADNYSVIVTADRYQSAGFFPVKIDAKKVQNVTLMLLRKDGDFNFHEANWASLEQRYPQIISILAEGTSSSIAATRYTKLIESHPGSVATILNLAVALSSIDLPIGTPLRYFKTLDWNEIEKGRFVGYADKTLSSQLAQAAQHGLFAAATPAPRPTTVQSYKHINFGGAGVELVLSESDTRLVGGLTCVRVEAVVDYFKDPSAHYLLEVVVNKSQQLLDPKQVYALWWMAGRHAGVPEFNPPYTIE
jgi:hypothetical protein